MEWELIVLNESTGQQYSISRSSSAMERMKFEQMIETAEKKAETISLSGFFHRTNGKHEKPTDPFFIRRLFPHECLEGTLCNNGAHCPCVFIHNWKPEHPYNISIDYLGTVVFKGMVPDSKIDEFLFCAAIEMHDFKGQRFDGGFYHFPIDFIKKCIMAFFVRNNLKSGMVGVTRTAIESNIDDEMDVWCGIEKEGKKKEKAFGIRGDERYEYSKVCTFTPKPDGGKEGIYVRS